MCLFSSKTDKFDFFCPNWSKSGFWRWDFENLNPDAESTPARYHMYQFSGKTDDFDFFGPNLPKNWFWGLNSKNLSLDSESAPPIYHVRQFSDQTDIFEFFSLNLVKLPKYVQYFGSYNVEDVAEKCVESEMSWVEVDGAGWR